MPPVLIRDHALPRARSSTPLVAGLVAVALVLAVVVGRVTALPSFVPRLTFDNAGAYNLNIDVAAANDAGWLNVGTVGARATASYLQVIDQGPRWVIRFSYGGIVAGAMTESRQQLRADKWQVVVPADVPARLAAAGVTPSP